MRYAALAALLAATPVNAEVVSASPGGFEVRQTVTVAAPPAKAYAAFGHVESWWSDDHSYSGKAANLSLALTPGGCWCEKLPNGGGVRHMQVAFLDPGKHIILTGSLGPLLSLATTGVMDVQFKRVPEGTQVILDYRVAGFFNGGADKIAPGVDVVLAEQVKRFAAAAVR
jgi:uncharacterized protein YndB with AHSA1/START domain